MKLLLETLLVLGQNAINYALSLDPHTQQALHELQNCCIGVHVKTLDKTIYLFIDTQKIFLGLRPFKTVDLTISASVKNLWHLKNKTHAPQQHIEMHGNMHIAQQLSQILHHFHPDWEEVLAHTTGDVIGHSLAHTLRSAHAYVKNLASDMMHEGADYFVDEHPLIAAKASIDHFMSEVDNLRTKTERLWVRVHLLNQRI